MKKNFTLLCVLNIALLLVAGCSSSNSAFLNQKIRFQKHESTVSKTENPIKNPSLTYEPKSTFAQNSVSSNQGFVPKKVLNTIQREESTTLPQKGTIHPNKTEVSTSLVNSTSKTRDIQPQLKQKNSKVSSVKNNKSKDDTDLILMIVLCFFIPPLAVFLKEGQQWTERCTLNLILTFLCGIPGVIHALIVVTGK